MSITDPPARALRIAGAPDAYNEPFTSTTFPAPVEFVPSTAGKRELLGLLQSGSVDAALLPTETAVGAVAQGLPVRLLSPLVSSPRRWATLVRESTRAEDLSYAKWVTLERGSASDTLPHMLAARRDWPSPTVLWPNASNWPLFPDPALNELVEAASHVRGRGSRREGDAHLAETHVLRSLFRMEHGIGHGLTILPGIDATWPAFAVVVRGDCQIVQRVQAAINAFLREAESFQEDEETGMRVAEKYGMSLDEVADWISGLRYARPGERFEKNAIRSVLDALVNSKFVPTVTRFNLSDFVI